MKDIQAIVAGSAICPKANVYAMFREFGNRGDAAGKLEVGAWAMRDRAVHAGPEVPFQARRDEPL